MVLIRFYNAVSYVQGQIDNKLRPYEDFERAYIDDVVSFSKTLNDHLPHLDQVLGLFDKLDVALQRRCITLKTHSTTPTLSHLLRAPYS